MIEFGLQIGIFVFLLALGLFAGSRAERSHFRSLRLRQARNADMLVTQIKSYPAHLAGSSPPQLVVAEVVVATDYLKSFLARLRNVFGGEVKSFQSLLERARGEVTQRLLEEARRQGFNAICNLRLETADVGGNSTTRRVAMVAILGTATAYQAEKD